MRLFYYLLGNNTFASVINFTVWFAITFYVIEKTHSVFAAGMIAGLYLVLTAITGIWFGSLVDHYKKKQVMLTSSIISLIFYISAFILYLLAKTDAIAHVENPLLWVFIIVLMIGVVAGNIRNIAMSTLVTILVPEKIHDKANGLVGITSGISFTITSVISGFLVGRSGMYEVLILALVVTIGAIVHLFFIHFPEKVASHSEEKPKKVDLAGTIKVISVIPGLFALIIFNSINNFLGGVFMALMDAYGLSLVSVEVWGIIWGVLGTAFIIGGIVISKIGLGKNPVRSMLLANLCIWIISCFFTVPQSIWPMVVGMFFYLCIIPFIEASEQTILQKVVPPERQGRVFGFSQSIEQSASPLTALLIGPLTQFFFIPFMTNGLGAKLIGSWFGTGYARGIALVFTMTGFIGLALTFYALRSKYYHQLSKYYLK